MTRRIKALDRETIREIERNALAELEAAEDAQALEAVRVRYMGRKGIFRDAASLLGKADPAERPALGKALNAARNEVEESLKGKSFAAPKNAEKRRAFDFTLPGRPAPRGRLHPITRTIEAVKDIFGRLGFEIAYGPEVELDHYNFEALNIPADHPARDAFDTFYLRPGVCLRSQTSTVQIRTMERRRPPVRILAPGKVYRPDTVDATHSFLFHQIEGLVVDEGVTMADLKYVLHQFARGLLGHDVGIRFRPSFFPFTEPSVEVDVTCFKCNGKGCPLCKRSGWIEILGAGMVDPNVFGHVGYDAEQYTGFAFGMGVERIAMLSQGIDDIRLFMDNDLRFLEQF